VSEFISPSDHHEFLDNLADCLGHVLSEGGDPFLVHVNPKADGPDIGILPLDGLAPADALLEMVAPEEWSALGVAAGGWARSMDYPEEGRSRAEMVVIVARDGHVVARVRHGGEVTTDPPASGLTLDGLQRALGLPTAPPDVPVTHLLTTAWLERVIETGRRRRRPLSWSAIRNLHPAWELIGTSIGADADLVELNAELEQCTDWDRLRWAAVEGRWEVPDLTPSAAAWCDAGAFSRWALTGRRPVPSLLAELQAVIGPAHARRCARIVRRAGARSAA
jgi:hypothetical protein